MIRPKFKPFQQQLQDQNNHKTPQKQRSKSYLTSPKYHSSNYEEIQLQLQTKEHQKHQHIQQQQEKSDGFENKIISEKLQNQNGTTTNKVVNLQNESRFLGLEEKIDQIQDYLDQDNLRKLMIEIFVDPGIWEEMLQEEELRGVFRKAVREKQKDVQVQLIQKEMDRKMEKVEEFMQDQVDLCVSQNFIQYDQKIHKIQGKFAEFQEEKVKFLKQIEENQTKFEESFEEIRDFLSNFKDQVNDEGGNQLWKFVRSLQTNVKQNVESIQRLQDKFINNQVFVQEQIKSTNKKIENQNQQGYSLQNNNKNRLFQNESILNELRKSLNDSQQEFSSSSLQQQQILKPLHTLQQQQQLQIQRQGDNNNIEHIRRDLTNTLYDLDGEKKWKYIQGNTGEIKSFTEQKQKLQQQQQQSLGVKGNGKVYFKKILVGKGRNLSFCETQKDSKLVKIRSVSRKKNRASACETDISDNINSISQGLALATSTDYKRINTSFR